MLKLFSNKSDHPLASLKSAQQLLDNIPKTDPVEVLLEVGEWIETLFDPANEFRLDHQYAVMRLLDDAAHPQLRRIIHSYFAVLPPAAFQENRLWGSMNTYFSLCESGYLNLLAGLKNEAKGSSSIKSFLPLITVRGIYALSGRLECAAVRYALIDPKIWEHLALFYAYAEEQKCLDEQLAVYSGLGASTTVRSMFASFLMWYTVAVGSLKPQDMHIAKRLIAYMSKSFVVKEQYIPGSLFSFDLAHPASPARVKEDGAMYPHTMRFVSAGSASKLFDDMVRTLNKDLVPEELSMGVSYGAELVREVASHLATCCHAPLPMRRQQRRKIKVNMGVASGFSKMVERTSVDLYLDEDGNETWDVEDVSANGFRCVIPAGNPGNIKIGVLVGLQPEKVAHWGVGVVRRLSRDEQNNLHVGIELLARKVFGVVLHGHDGYRADASHPALLLEKSGVPEGEGWVLMKNDTYSSSRSPTMTMGEESYLLMPLALLEKGDDFHLAHYRMMAQDSGAEDSY